ncbi:glycosyltransferase [Pirellulales bacterium]|nr:glycosyltransferase [Pirellulales bacterium]
MVTTTADESELPIATIPIATSVARKVRVCYIIAAIDTPHAGTEGHLLRLIRGLDKHRFEPHLVVLKDSPYLESQPISDVPVHILGFESFKRLRNWFLIFSLAKWLRRLAPDVVELYFTDAHFLGAFAAWIARVPAVISCRRDIAHQYGKKELYLSKLANPLVTQFVANSQVVVDKVARLEGIDPDRFTVIRNGIEIAKVEQEEATDLPAAFEDFCRGRRVVCLAANLRDVKNVPMFLRVARELLSSDKKLGFVILGSGEEEAKLRRMAIDYKISQNVYWAGSVPSIIPYLVAVDIACLTSKAEGFSNVIVEYMAVGKPVVATDVGGAAEAIVHGENGFLVGADEDKEFALYVKKLLDDRSLRDEMGLAGRRRVSRYFAFSDQMNAYQQIYASCAQ